MEDFLNGGVNELKEARAAILAGAEISSQAAELTKALKAKEKEIDGYRKRTTERIDYTIKENRKTVMAAYDDAVDKANKELKEAEKVKKAAKAEAVASRVKSETADMVGEIERVKQENRELFKQHKIPGFCNTEYYYAMFAPKKPFEYVIFIVTLIICLALIPNLVCLLAIPAGQVLVKILVYAAIVVFFAGIYFLVAFLTKCGGRADIIAEARANIDAIASKRKEIDKTARTIRKDKDESQYSLGEYDEEIARRTDVVKEKEAERAEALRVFEEQTAPSIRNQIESDAKPVLDDMGAVLEQLKTDEALKSKEAHDTAERLADEYGSYLGSRNMSVARIDELIDIMEQGRAGNISQALKVLSGEIK